MTISEIITNMPTPYYRDKAGVIFCGDCLELMPMMPRLSMPLIITDPPYSVGVSSSGKKADYGDNSLIKPFLRGWGNEAFRIIKDSGAIYINCDWRTYPIWWDCLFPLRSLTNLIVWNYKWIKAGSHYRFTHEFIMFWAMNNHKLVDKETADVWEIPPINFTVEKRHPAEKPVELVKRMLEKSGGDIILDPFLGSGTTVVAAKELGRKFIGIEINQKYCDIAVERLRQEMLPLNNAHINQRQ